MTTEMTPTETDRTIGRNTSELFRRLAALAAPPPDLTVSEWADEFRMLSAEASAEPGRWRTDRAPYQRDILDAISDPTVPEVVVMTSSQVGKTEIVLNGIGYFIDYDASPILVVQPTIEMGEAFSKDRLAPMIRDCPALSSKIGDARSRDSGNTLLHKCFPGGHVTISGANSPSSLASRPIRIVFFDEVDRYPASAGTEGDPVTLAEKRTTAFWNRKVIKVSTPTIKGLSRIDVDYETSTQGRWCLPCPSCGTLQQLVWGQIRFEDVTHECAYCGKRHDELAWKRGRGRWIHAYPERQVKGFHLNELVSPWRRWDEIIVAFQKANEQAKIGNPELLKAWVNTSLGETWEEAGESLEHDYLERRREYYDAEVPRGVVVLTCGVDVQDDRVELEVVGWGAGKQSWGIEYRQIHGDPARPELWAQLDEYLSRTWEFESGARIGISCTCVDSGGHFTDEVYQFVKSREHRRIFAIKGRGGAGLPLVGKATRNNRRKVALFPIGVDTGKELILSRLKVEHEGGGYCHFPRESERGYDESYFKGLLSEKRVMRFRAGKKTLEWVKKAGARNEPLDCRNYATAALEIYNPKLDSMAAQVAINRPQAPAPAISHPPTPSQVRQPVAPRPLGRRVLSRGVSL